MDQKVKKIAVTGGAGQIAYSLLFEIANGNLLGPNQPIELNIIDLPDTLQVLKAVFMELEDCAFPLLNKIRIGSDVNELFQDIDVAFLIGAKPRGPGMERSDLLKDNGHIFVHQGKALNQSAKKDVKVLVLGNPCNTNCLIAMHHAPNLNSRNFHAMMRLDENRAKNLIANKAQVPVSQVDQMTIWGNHSSTQVPDYANCTISGQNCLKVITDLKWLQKDFIESNQKRGSVIIAARGKSSAASAAHAAIQAMKDLIQKPKNNWFTSAVYTKSNPYGIEEDIVFGFPCRLKDNGDYEIIPNLEWDNFIKEKIAMTQKELIEEKKIIQPLLDL